MPGFAFFILSLSSPSSLWDLLQFRMRSLSLKFVAWLEIGFCCSFTRYRHLSLKQNFFFPWFANRVSTVSLCLCFAFTIDLLYILIPTVHFFSTSRFRLVLPSLLLIISNHESTVDFIPFVRNSFMYNAEFHNLHLFHPVYPI